MMLGGTRLRINIRPNSMIPSEDSRNRINRERTHDSIMHWHSAHNSVSQMRRARHVELNITALQPESDILQKWQDEEKEKEKEKEKEETSEISSAATVKRSFIINWEMTAFDVQVSIARFFSLVDLVRLDSAWANRKGLVRLYHALSAKNHAGASKHNYTSELHLSWTIKRMPQIQDFLLQLPLERTNGLNSFHFLCVQAGPSPAEITLISALALKGRERIHHCDRYNMNVLHRVALDGSVNTAALLVKLGAEVDACDNAGRTPLFLACLRRRVGMADLLMCYAKANPTIRSNSGLCALDLIVEDMRAEHERRLMRENRREIIPVILLLVLFCYLSFSKMTYLLSSLGHQFFPTNENNDFGCMGCCWD